MLIKIILQTIISKFGLNITRFDFAFLDGLNWLNDNVINFYMELMKERSQQVEYLPKVHVMNTNFLQKLMESGYQSIRRWTRKVDIFAYDIIPVPVIFLLFDLKFEITFFNF